MMVSYQKADAAKTFSNEKATRVLKVVTSKSHIQKRRDVHPSRPLLQGFITLGLLSGVALAAQGSPRGDASLAQTKRRDLADFIRDPFECYTPVKRAIGCLEKTPWGKLTKEFDNKDNVIPLAPLPVLQMPNGEPVKTLGCLWGSLQYQIANWPTLKAQMIQKNKKPFNVDFCVDRETIEGIINSEQEKNDVYKIYEGVTEKCYTMTKKGKTTNNPEDKFSNFQKGCCTLLQRLNATDYTSLQKINNEKASWTFVPFMWGAEGPKYVLDMGSGKCTTFSGVNIPIDWKKQDISKEMKAQLGKKTEELKYVMADGTDADLATLCDAQLTAERLFQHLRCLPALDGQLRFEIYGTGKWRNDRPKFGQVMKILNGLMEGRQQEIERLATEIQRIANLGQQSETDETAATQAGLIQQLERFQKQAEIPMTITECRPLEGDEEALWGTISIMNLNNKDVERCLCEAGYEYVIFIESGNGSTQYTVLRLKEKYSKLQQAERAVREEPTETRAVTEDEKSAHPTPQPGAASPKPMNTQPIAALAPIARPHQSPRGSPRTPRAEGTPKSSKAASPVAKPVKKPAAPKQRTGLYMKRMVTDASSNDSLCAKHGVLSGTVQSVGSQWAQRMEESQRTGVRKSNLATGDLVIYQDPLNYGRKSLYKVIGESKGSYTIQPADGRDGENVKTVGAYTLRLAGTRRRVLESISHDIETAKRM